MKHRRDADRDDLDGCEDVGPYSRANPTTNAELPYVALFAGVNDPSDPAELEARRLEWEALFR